MFLNFRDRLARIVIILGIILFGFACCFLKEDRFVINSSGQKRIVTRQDHPLVYWGTEFGFLFVGVSLVAYGIYRVRKPSVLRNDGSFPESSARRGSIAMRVTSIIVAVFGVLNLLSLPRGISFTDNPKWPLMLFGSLFGIFLIWIAFGIWRRRIIAWQLGFLAIALSAVFFVVQVCFDLPAVGTGQKVLIISVASVGGILVAVYWSVVWYRQKKWFSCDHLA
jgi:hypothetical protein